MTKVPLKVLILEDNPYDAELNISTLGQEDWDIEPKVTDNEDDFRKALRDFNPDIVLSDYNLPSFNGLDALELVKNEYPFLPFVIVTGSLDEETAVNCIKEGAWDYVLKEHLIRLNPAVRNALIHKDEMLKHQISQTRYESVFNSVSDGIFLYDAETLTLEDVNKRVLELYEYSKEDILKLSIGELSDSEHGYDNETARMYAGKAVKGEIQQTEWKARSSSGRILWISVVLKTITIGEKKYLMGIVKDIDQQKKAEDSLKKSRELYQALAQNSPDVIMRFDREHRHIFVNDKVEDLIGMGVENFTGKTHKEMGVFPEEMVHFWEQNIDRVFDLGQHHTVEFSIPTAGNTLEIEWRLFPEFDDLGKTETVLAIARDITESKRNTLKIRESEERLKMALEGTSDGLWDLNLINQEIYFSPRYFTMLGYQPTEFDHNREVLLKLIHPEDIDRIVEYINQTIENRNPAIEMEMRLKRKEGSYTWILSRGKLITNEEGVPVRMVGIHEDISHRKRQQEIQDVLIEIANSVNNTRNLDELFLNIQSSLGKIIDTKNCYVALYDEKTQLISLPFHKDEKDSFQEFPAGKTVTGYVIKTGEAQLVDEDKIEELAKQGEIEPIGAPSVSWLGVPLKISDKIIGVFVVQSYDENIKYTSDDVQLLEFVSDQIALAIERRIDQDKLKRNEERQRRIIESSPDGLVVIDTEGRILTQNTSFVNLVKLKTDHLGLNFFDFVMDNDVIKVQNILNDTLKSGYTKNIQFKMKREDGSDFFAESSFGVINSQEKDGDSFVIVMKNIDERKAYEHNLRIAKEKAEESDRLKTAFLSNMSHEIRTPMNAIIGFAELLSRMECSEEEKREFLQQINQGADTLMRLIDDIIDISKIEAGQLKMNTGIFNLAPLLNDLHVVYSKFLTRSSKEHILVKHDSGNYDIDIQLHTDEFRLRQVFSNLLNNAVKFTEQGEIRYGIKEMNKQGVVFYVRDTGVGISKDMHEIIFQRFRQGHSSKKSFYGGTGLGLAISKHLVGMMGGEMKVESEPDKGAEFTFNIPYDSLDYDLPSEELNHSRKAGDWEGRIILVAEDDRSNFQLIHEILRKTQITILWAKNGEEAFQKCKENPGINLVLMDIQMPVLNGYDATRQIKEIRPSLPVIAQTAYAMAGEKALSRDAGCDDYISKPIRIQELMDLISKYLDK